LANAITHTDAVRAALGDAFRTAVGATGSKLVIYSGTMPANAQAALSGNVAIATITGIALGASAAGVGTITASIADPSAVGGTASFFRWTNSAGTACLQGTVGTSGTDLVLNSVTIVATAVVTLSTGTYTAPA
jgi:hypothetical protein